MSDDDPFEDLDAEAYDDREGDPFESLSTPDEEDDGDGQNADADRPVDEGRSGSHSPDSDDASSDDTPGQFGPDSDGPKSDPFEYLGDRKSDWADDLGDAAASREGSRPGEGTREARTDSVDIAGDPFGDVDVSRGDPFESADSPFERVDVGGADPDAVWDRLTEDPGSAAEGPGSVHEDNVDASEAGVGGADDAAGDDVVTVSKHSFCEGCPHFSSPPAVACGHEGTEILAFVGPDDVRIANCPIVDERRELGEVHE